MLPLCCLIFTLAENVFFVSWAYVSYWRREHLCPCHCRDPFLFNVEFHVLFHAFWDLPIVAPLSHNLQSELLPVSELRAGTSDSVYVSPDLCLGPLILC